MVLSGIAQQQRISCTVVVFFPAATTLSAMHCVIWFVQCLHGTLLEMLLCMQRNNI